MNSVNINYFGKTRAWWAITLVGLLTIVVGFVYWFWPAISYVIAAQLFGWLLVGAGVVQLCVATGAGRERMWGWWLVAGIVNIFIGFVLVRSVVLSEMMLPYFFAILFIFYGVQSILSTHYSRGGISRWLGLINGLLLFALAYFFLESGWLYDMLMVSVLISVGFIYWGFTLVIASLDMRPEKHAE